MLGSMSQKVRSGCPGADRRSDGSRGCIPAWWLHAYAKFHAIGEFAEEKLVFLVMLCHLLHYLRHLLRHTSITQRNDGTMTMHGGNDMSIGMQLFDSWLKR